MHANYGASDLRGLVVVGMQFTKQIHKALVLFLGEWANMERVGLARIRMGMSTQGVASWLCCL